MADTESQIHGSLTSYRKMGSCHLHRISCPNREEQRAIATVLLDMDAEIAALEQRRNKTKAIKQGMMQSLLTGRVRLVESEPSTGAA